MFSINLGVPIAPNIALNSSFLRLISAGFFGSGHLAIEQSIDPQLKQHFAIFFLWASTLTKSSSELSENFVLGKGCGRINGH